jgi:hypothetical protein
VTPKHATKRWKPALEIVAVDNTMAMIHSVWPGNNSRRNVVRGDWLQLPLRDACIDVALIDGGLPAISFPLAHAALVRAAPTPCRLADRGNPDDRRLSGKRRELSFSERRRDDRLPCRDLSCVEEMHGTYELAERCPILIFRREPTR